LALIEARFFAAVQDPGPNLRHTGMPSVAFAAAHYNSPMRIAALLLLCLLTSCPAHKPPASAPAAGAAASGTAAASWPPEAVAYLQQCLERPGAEGGVPLGPACIVVAQLPQAGADPAFAGVKQALLRWRGQMGESVASELAAGWLTVEPDAAREQIAARIAKGDEAVFQALRYNPSAGRAVLAKIDAAKLTLAQANRVLELMRIWGQADVADKPLLMALAQREPVVAWRALGYLLRLEPDNAEYLKQLDQALRNAKPDQLAAAVEGAKISAKAELAAALVPLLVQVKPGPERITPADVMPQAGADPGAAAPADFKAPGQSQPSAKPQAKAAQQPPLDHKALLGAYGLTYLPGEAAQFARRKLLDAEDPQLRWQARLGELLHGDAKPWNDAVQAQGVEQREMWVALEPPEAWDAALLRTYARAAQSAQALTRGRTAQHLGRYGSCRSEKQALQALSKLAAAPEPEVAEVAWYTLARLRLDPTGADPLTVVNDANAAPAVRLAAAYCALRLAGHGAAQ
jgi:hypothetical protein